MDLAAGADGSDRHGSTVDLLDFFAIVVLLVLAVSVVVLAAVLGALPGRIAHKRHHPHADAITISGWVGLIFVLLWPLALIWAYIDVPRTTAVSDDNADLRRVS